jgi:hypothetical protein
LLTEEDVAARLERLTAQLARTIEEISVSTGRRHRYVLLIAAADGLGPVHYSDNLYEQERSDQLRFFGAHLNHLSDGQVRIE